MHARLITIAAVAMAIAGCFKASPPATDPAAPDTTISSESIFPHKSNWKDPVQHGVYVKDTLNMDMTTCLSCHGEANTTNGGAPSCRSCHKNFPHTEPGVTLATHGDYVLKNGKADCATQCHGTDLKGGLSGKPCTECHKVYPHASGWAAPSVHGPEAKGELKLTNKCNLCHGGDWNGGISKKSCIDCHKAPYPHPTGWASPDQHGTVASTNGTGKCATQCHGVQLDGGLSGVSCKDGCHKVWPHPATGWMAVHGQKARTLGLSGCTGCHKNDATGGKTGITCTQCHNSLPAHVDADWSKTGHGKLVMQQPVSLTDPKGCPLCHGAKLEGGKTPTLPGLKALKGCKDCHASYPALHKTATDAPAWSSFDGHGKWVINQIVPDKDGKFANVLNQINTLITDCKLCHGDDLKGGNVGKGCYVSGCHTNFPHNIDVAMPWLSKHGGISNAEAPKAASCATGNCHGKDLQGLPIGEKEVSKKWVRGCADCHLQMPHQALKQWDHGKSVIITVEVTSKNGVTQQDVLDVNKCTACHGEDWKGKNDAPSCYANCHAAYPQPHRDAKGALSTVWKPSTGHAKWVMDTYKEGSVKNTAATPCKICHGSELTGGASGKTCYKCHKSFPHAAAPVVVGGATTTFTDAAWNGLAGFAKSHGQYVMAQATLGKVSGTQQAKTECGKSCHGTDLLGGTSKKSCFTCHATYPHATDWKKVFDPADSSPGGAHGIYVKQNGSSGCLQGCHSIDPPGGNSGAACSTCHAAYPHPTTGIADWKSGHKTFISQLATKGNITPFAVITSECVPCHLSAGPPAKNNCATCHHQTVADWKTKGQHGTIATNDITGCKSCHGPDLNAGSLTNNKTCVTCHGPGTKATLSSHQDKTEMKTYYDQYCKDCLDGTPENCMDCAGDYYDYGDPKQQAVITSFVQSLHGNMAKTNLKSCQVCHGDKLEGGVSGKTCFVTGACHDPGDRYKDHATNKALWLQQMAAVPPQVEMIAALDIKYPGGKMGYCTTACHNVLYPALYGKPTFDLMSYNCVGCHKSK